MSLSQLLQPKSNLRFCRLSFSTARARFCSSSCSNGDNRPQLKEEAALEDSAIKDVEPLVKESGKKPGLFSKAASIANLMAGYVGSNKAKTLFNLFMEHKDNQTGTTDENEGRKPEATLLEYQHERCEGGERSSQSDSSPEVLDFKKLSMKSTFDGAALEIDKPRSLTSTYQPFEHSNEPPGEHAEKISSKGLIRTEDVSSNSTKCCSSAGLFKDNSLYANSQRSDNNDRPKLLDFLAATPSNDDTERCNLDDKYIDFKGLKACLKDSFPKSNEDQGQRPKTCSAITESVENRVLVRFLRNNVTENHMLACFNGCGEILKVEGPYSHGPLFKSAYIDFKTREGYQKALKQFGSMLHNGTLIVESATSMEKKTVQIPIPDLLGDPDIPPALVKNPTRTIKVEQLTHEISSRHIEEALAFCKSNISGYSLGSSDSVAFVEFETEVGKEKALAKQSINVLGRHLVMLRIDCPRTTVVRISNTENLKLRNVVSICKSLGGFSSSTQRGSDTLDVHFKLAEWPNMVKILNRLNGCIVEGRRLQAEPAPVFPPDVLLALWHHPEERKHLQAAAQVVLHKLVENRLDASELAFLEKGLLRMYDLIHGQCK